MHPFYFVTQELKDLLTTNKLFEVTFQWVDYFFAGLNLLDTCPNYNFNESNFWLLSVIEKNDHFIIYENKLIVSVEALDFLVEHKAFKPKIYRGVYGKEYEYIDNIYQLRGSPELYFNNHYNNDLQFVQQKEVSLLKQYKSINRNLK